MTSDTADRNDKSPNTPQSTTRGRLFDTAFYQAWAVDDSGVWRYLPADATPDAPADPPGASWRERVRDGALRCPFPDCGTTYSGIRRGAGRLAFVHPKSGGTHTDKQSKETLWRLAARQTVARWATTGRPGATVQFDDIDLPVTPDVLVTLPDGGRIAVECRYATFSAGEWRERHEAYQRLGLAEVWLLGNTGPQARKVTGDPERLRPPAPVADMVAEGVQVAWLNPFLGLIGTPTQVDDAGTAVAESPIADWAPTVASEATGSNESAGSVEAVEPAGSAGPAEGAEPAAASRSAFEQTATSAPADSVDTAGAVTPPAADAEVPAAVTGESAEETGEPIGEPVDSETEPAGTEESATVGEPSPTVGESTPDAGAAVASDVPPVERAEKPVAEAPEPAKEAEVGTAADGPTRPTGLTGLTGPALHRVRQVSQDWWRRVRERLRRPAA